MGNCHNPVSCLAPPITLSWVHLYANVEGFTTAPYGQVWRCWRRSSLPACPSCLPDWLAGILPADKCRHKAPAPTYFTWVWGFSFRQSIFSFSMTFSLPSHLHRVFFWTRLQFFDTTLFLSSLLIVLQLLPVSSFFLACFAHLIPHFCARYNQTFANTHSGSVRKEAWWLYR